VLWVRSYWVFDNASWGFDDGPYLQSLTSTNGILSWSNNARPYRPTTPRARLTVYPSEPSDLASVVPEVLFERRHAWVKTPSDVGWAGAEWANELRCLPASSTSSLFSALLCLFLLALTVLSYACPCSLFTRFGNGRYLTIEWSGGVMGFTAQGGGGVSNFSMRLKPIPPEARWVEPGGVVTAVEAGTVAKVRLGSGLECVAVAAGPGDAGGAGVLAVGEEAAYGATEIRTGLGPSIARVQLRRSRNHLTGIDNGGLSAIPKCL